MRSKPLNERIRQARLEQRLTHEQVAEKLNISPTHEKHIESGNRKPSLNLLFQIARVLNLSLDDIAFDVEPDQDAAVRGKIDRLLDICSDRELRLVLALLQEMKKDSEQ